MIRRLTSFFIIIALAGAGGGQVVAALPAPTACSISGWSADPDPAGLNVRAGPSASAKILGRIPPARAQASDTYGAEFDIIGSQGGWLLIRKARFADYGDGKGDSAVFSGPGWVFADKVRFLINAPELRIAPREQAPTVARLSSADGSSGPDSAVIDHVYGCSGAFADVAAHTPGKPSKRGWATRICSNQVTTCP